MDEPLSFNYWYGEHTYKILDEEEEPTSHNFYFQKYVAMWPHCDGPANNVCFDGDTTLADAEAMCNDNVECVGFSFETMADVGWGCLKLNCYPEEIGGYGYDSHDYYEK